MFDFDVAVIGASLSGSAAATIIARAGYRVAIFDKGSFPRRKPCGEGLSKLGLAVIDRLGLKPSVLSADHADFKGYRISSGSKTCDVPDPDGGGIAVAREVLDKLVIQNAASERSLEFFDSTPVLGVTTDGQIKLKDRVVSAKFVVIADGGSSQAAERIGIPFTRLGRPRTGGSVVLEGSFAKPLELVNIFLKPGYELYCTQVSKTRLNLSVLVSENAKLNVRELLLDPALLSELKERIHFSGEVILNPLGRSGLGNRSRASVLGTNIYLVGDACQEFDPLGGMGMSHALISGELAGTAIARVLSGDLTPHLAVSNYTNKRARVASAMHRFTNLTGIFMASATKFPLLLNLARRPLTDLSFAISGLPRLGA